MQVGAQGAGLSDHAAADGADVARPGAVRQVAGGAVFRAGAARGERGDALRVLYVASAIEAGSASGGWTHVTEVAGGLRDLGHEVLLIAQGRLPQYLAL